MLRFTDDIAVIAENENELQMMLRLMEETLLNELNTKKKKNKKRLKFLYVAKNNKIKARIHRQNNQEIEQVESRGVRIIRKYNK